MEEVGRLLPAVTAPRHGTMPFRPGAPAARAETAVVGDAAACGNSGPTRRAGGSAGYPIRSATDPQPLFSGRKPRCHRGAGPGIGCAGHPGLPPSHRPKPSGFMRRTGIWLRAPRLPILPRGEALSDLELAALDSRPGHRCYRLQPRCPAPIRYWWPQPLPPPPGTIFARLRAGLSRQRRRHRAAIGLDRPIWARHKPCHRRAPTPRPRFVPSTDTTAVVATDATDPADPAMATDPEAAAQPQAEPGPDRSQVCVIGLSASTAAQPTGDPGTCRGPH